MDRFLQNTTVTLAVQVMVNEVGTNPSPDSATVTVTRADGTVLVDNLPAVDGLNGGFEYVLTPAQTALLDRLTAAWTVTLNGQPQVLRTHAEIVGGFHFSLDSLRRLSPLENTSTYTTARLQEARLLAETIIEDACGRAFVPRYTLERVNASPNLTLRNHDVTRVRSVVGSTTLSQAELDDLVVLGGNFASPWRSYRGYVTVGYEHGMASCPPDVAIESMKLARYLLVQGPTDDRATSVSSEFGTTSMWTPGIRGAVTPLPSVDAMINRHRILAFA